jgi:hypothetical protein
LVAALGACPMSLAVRRTLNRVAFWVAIWYNVSERKRVFSNIDPKMGIEWTEK